MKKSGGSALVVTTDDGNRRPLGIVTDSDISQAVADERGRPPRVAGVPWGADMRLFGPRGIPCVMAGTTGIERAHAIDEWVALDELAALARIIVRAVIRSAA
jgi:acetylornithine deacetylase